MWTNLSDLLNRVHHSDCVAFMKTLPDNCIDSIVTDPPYELWFMGKSWDNTGIANSIEMRGECLRILKPWWHLLSFSGTRTYHRMACAIEDAGFEVRDMIEWVYGSGFPKSLNIGKAVDKLHGNESKKIGSGERETTNAMGNGLKNRCIECGKPFFSGNPCVCPKPKANNEWNGWGTALKPAHEPICMARKPLEEKTVAENVLKYGTGWINIDESRVEYQGDADWNNTFRPSTNIDKNCWIKDKNTVARVDIINRNGRFPANLIHDNSEEVRECFPETNWWSAIRKNKQNPYGNDRTWSVSNTPAQETAGYTDSGNASRFFKSILYYPKASKAERNKGCEGLDIKGRQWKMMHKGNNTSDEVSEWFERFDTQPSSNNHPTVKSLPLMEYLIKMVTKEWGIVFDPFTWSWTTLVAAKKNWFQYLGTEMTDEYIPIIEARLNATELEEEEIIDKWWFG